MAEELDFSIGFHEGSTNAMPTVGVDRFEDDRAARHMVSHTMEMMLVALSVIWGGVVDRHPRLRVAFLESGGGWIAPWLDRMDRHFDDQGFNESAPKTRPSELFQRNCWISFEPVESSIAVLADYIGPHKSMWASSWSASNRRSGPGPVPVRAGSRRRHTSTFSAACSPSSRTAGDGTASISPCMARWACAAWRGPRPTSPAACARSWAATLSSPAPSIRMATRTPSS